MHQLWIADITYVPTWAGFVFLAVVVDAFSRRVVGWAMESHLRTSLVLDALNMALTTRKPDSVIHHSDQGCQYTSLAFGKRCEMADVRPSTGSVGDCYDNAMCGGGFDRRRGPETPPANKLSDAERRRILDTANSPEFRDVSAHQMVPRLAERGEYVGSEWSGPGLQCSNSAGSRPGSRPPEWAQPGARRRRNPPRRPPTRAIHRPGDGDSFATAVTVIGRALRHCPSSSSA
ncbi:MAG: transposase InsO family protein, partial [Myxococcota bacterium]